MAAQVLDGRYKLIKKLGSGGFGHTYIARDMRRPGSPMCVVKQLRPASNDPDFIREARRLFHTEAEVLEKLGKHDQIPQLLAYFEEDNHFFLVQEYIEGTPLNQEWEEVVSLPPEAHQKSPTDEDGTLIQTRVVPKTITEKEAIVLLKDVLGILEFVHSEGVIHRDIKPDNLIRRHSDGKVVLIDFGAVKSLQSGQMPPEDGKGESRYTVSIGTPGYMASEQMAGRPNFASDIYSLGMVIIRGLTGYEPADLPTDPDTGEVIWRDKVRVSNGLAMVLTRMTRYNHTQRYKSAREVLQGIQALCPEEEIGTTAHTQFHPRATTVAPTRRSTLDEKERTYPVTSTRSNSGAGILVGGLVALLAFGLLGSLPLLMRRPTADNSPAPTATLPNSDNSSSNSTPTPQPSPVVLEPIVDRALNVSNETIDLRTTNIFASNGLIPSNSGINFNFQGYAGDKISVTVGNPSVVAMSITDSQNRPIASNAVNVNSFDGEIPKNGNYKIMVRPLRPENNTNYTLSFSVMRAVIIPEAVETIPTTPN